MLEWLESLPHAAVLRHSGTAYLFVNAAHIASIGVLLGAIVALDLRLLGVFPALPLASAGPFLSRMAAAGLVLAMLTGFWLFSVRPAEYAANPAFLAKLGLLALGILNAAVLHRSRAWRRALGEPRVPLTVRAQAAGSMLVWLSAILAGRWIGFL
ncbi:DUF2214 domain-containing protein [Pigmentiphaga sp. NML080357]|uniref:DUF6644 family protein n=1 Tax=Pigmentiphaga sp. NML080357 TaxID=2008675 RepID=UPI000B41034B|nr:DUF6644 family protein [Pigmentiphaga sp. NML080357]OVZ55499.1 DUF2214 domain-containing protein [Pigmentiphaga sp. NML080357]